MSTELATIDERLPVMMKSRVVHWVSPMTHERIQAQLQQQSGHTFMRVAELSITINTAEIEGVYTREQYDDLARIRAGQWQCLYQKWHNKKDDCQCRKEIEAEMQRRAREAANDAENRPQTEAERHMSIEKLRRMNETGALKNPHGIFGQMFLKHNSKGKAIRRSTIIAWIEKNGFVDVSGFEIEEDV